MNNYTTSVIHHTAVLMNTWELLSVIYRIIIIAQIKFLHWDSISIFNICTYIEAFNRGENIMKKSNMDYIIFRN